jgi:arabinofuranosyltransferase
MPRRIRDLALGRWAGTGVFTGALAVRLFLAPFFDFCFDDAYISFRVARNVARGLGMVFNAGERVLVTSTPLYTLLMAPGELLGMGAPLWSRLLNSVASAAACLLAYHLLRGKVRNGLLLFVVAALVLSPLSIFMSLSGMESPVVGLLLLLATLLYREGHGTRLGLVLGACFLVRPEGALAAGLFAVAVILFRRKIAWRVLLPLTSVVAAWLVYSISFFGSPIPHSLVAKQAYFATHHFSVLFNARDESRLLWATIPLFPLLLLFLPWGIRSAACRHREFLPLGVWVIAVLAAQLFSGFNLPWWYLDQLTPQFFLLLALGAEGLLSMTGCAGMAVFLRKKPVMVAITLASVLSSAFVVSSMWVEYMDTRNMDHIMGEIGRWFLSEGIPTDRTVAVEAIGRVGYETDLRILDTFGLASPEMIPLIRAEAMTDEEIMRKLMPDFFVSGAVLRSENTGGYTVAGSVLCPPLLRPVREGRWSSEPGECYIYRAPREGSVDIDQHRPPDQALPVEKHPHSGHNG